jgi:dolichol-phosphate mannosyltransferase
LTSESGARGPEVSIVVPLFNEAENVGELHRRLTETLKDLAVSYELLLVDDGSGDETPSLLDRLHGGDPHVVVLHLSRNFGHQAAVSAGLDYCQGRAVILMDGDLQDPPEVLPQFLAKWREGYEVVYAIREKRKEGLLKRAGYRLFYRLLRSISDLEIPLDSGDFSLMDRRVVEALRALPERKRFVRGLRTFVGFRQTGLRYERAAREAGRPKYTLAGLLGLAADGLVSFSSQPLRLVTYAGLFAAGFATLLTLWVIVDAVSARTAPRGWASLLVVVLFMGAVQLLALGTLGEYIRLIFLESKERPAYIVAERRDRTSGHDPADERVAGTASTGRGLPRGDEGQGRP